MLTKNKRQRTTQTQEAIITKARQIEKIVGKTTCKGQTKYRIKWKGLQTKDNTYESINVLEKGKNEEELKKLHSLINNYEKSYSISAKKSVKKVLKEDKDEVEDKDEDDKDEKEVEEFVHQLKKQSEKEELNLLISDSKEEDIALVKLNYY